jgi:hypothetical protein
MSIKYKVHVCILHASPIHREDIKHVHFKCEHEVWTKLGLLSTIQNALQINIARSVVLEEILASNNTRDVKELINYNLVLVYLVDEKAGGT